MPAVEEQAWDAFMNSPATYVVPSLMAEAFGNAIPEEVCEKLLDSPRIHRRLSEVLARHFGLKDDRMAGKVADEDRRIAVSDPEELEQIALRAGAIFWASSLAGSISGSRAAAMRTALGNELCAFALANRDLAKAEDRLDDEKDIGEQVQTIGLACLRAWADEMPPALAARFRLKVPEIAEAGTEGLGGRGSQLLRRAAA